MQASSSCSTSDVASEASEASEFEAPIYSNVHSDYAFNII